MGHRKLLKFVNLILASVFVFMALPQPVSFAADDLMFDGWKADRLFRDSEADAGARVESVLNELTLTEKVALSTGSTASAVARLGIGGGINSGGSGGDCHHGTQNGTWFPSSLGNSQAWDYDLFSRMGDLMGKEAGNGGVGGSHTMVADILRDPRYGRAVETFGEDGFLTGKLMTAITTGMTKRDENGYTGYRPTLKHFMGYNTETMRMWVNSSMPLRSQYEYHAMSFYYPVSAGGAKSVMTSYPLVNGKPMAVSHLLGKLLSEFTPDYKSKADGGDGATGHYEFLNTDDYGSGSSIHYNSQRYFYDDFLGRTIGYSYGAKMGNKGWSLRNAGGNVNHIWEGLNRGIITEEDIAESARRTLSVAVREGQYDQLGLIRSSQWQNRTMTRAALRELQSSKGLSLEASQSGIVLLKNDSGMLPLKGADVTDVVLLGMQSETVLYEYYARGYNYRITIRDAFENKLGKANVYHDRAVDTVAIKASNGLYLEGGTSLSVKPNDATPVRAIQAVKPTAADMKTNPAAFEIYDYGFDKLIRTPVNGLYVQTNVDDVAIARGSPWTWYNDNVSPGGENENVTTSPEWRSNSTLRIVPTPDGKYGFYAPNAGAGRNIPPSLTGGVKRPGTMSASDADEEELNNGSYLALNGLAGVSMEPGIRNVAGALTAAPNTTGMGTTDRIEVLFSTNGPWQNQDSVLTSKVDTVPDDLMVDNLPDNAKFELDMVQSAKEAAKAQIDAAGPNAPVVLVLGMDPGLSAREGTDYMYLGLGEQSIGLIDYITEDLGKDIILVVKMGNPMAVQREVADNPKVKSILTMGHCGPEEGPGLVSALFDNGYSVPLDGDWGPTRDSTAGRITSNVTTYTTYPGYRGPNGDGIIPGRSPAGRLSATWYDGESQMKGGQDAWTYAPASMLWPAFDEVTNNNFSNNNGSIPGGLQVYDIIKGERTYQYLNATPLYAFGHGLSYGDFTYSNVDVSAVVDGKFTVSGRVTNNGRYTADEVVEVYSSYLGGANSRIKHHNKRLIGFERLRDVAPGEGRNFSIEVTSIIDELGVFDVESDKKIVENGDYRIVVGGTSALTPIDGNSAIVNINSGNGGTALSERNLNRLVLAESFDDYSDVGGKVMDIEIVAANKLDYDCNYAASFRENGAWIKFGNVTMAENTNSLTASVGSDRAGRMKVYALSVGADPSALVTSSSVIPIAILDLTDTRTKQGLPTGLGISPVPGYASSPLGRTTDDNYLLPQMKTVSTAVSVIAGTYDIYFVSEPRGARFEWFKFGDSLDEATGGVIFDTYRYDSIRQPAGTLQLRVDLTPTTAADTVTWSITSGGALATIDASTGLLTATGMGNGDVTVTAACSGGASFSKDIMITNQLAGNTLMVGTTPKILEYLVFAAVTDNIARYKGTTTLNLTYYSPTDGFPVWSGDFNGQYAAGFTFAWTTLAAGNAIWTVTDPDDNPTDLATISNNVVTATGNGNGKVKVTAAFINNPDITAERIVHITNQTGNDAFTLIHPIGQYDTAVNDDISGTLAAPNATAAWTNANFTAETPFIPSQAGSVAAMTADQVLLFRDVDFGAGAAEVFMNIAATADSTVSLYIDRTDAGSGGTLIGSVDVSGTGNTGTYSTFGAEVDQNVTGKHDLFLVFSGAARLAYFQFVEATAITGLKYTGFSNLVSGCAANIPVEVSTANADGLTVFAGVYLDGELKVQAKVIDGKATIKVDAFEFATASIKAWIEETNASKEIQIPVKTIAPTLWVPAATESNGIVTITFAENISFAAKKSAAVRGAAATGMTIANGNQLEITGYGEAVSGNNVVTSGIKYPELFPSYSFTFTVPIG